MKLYKRQLSETANFWKSTADNDDPPEGFKLVESYQIDDSGGVVDDTADTDTVTDADLDQLADSIVSQAVASL